MSSSFKALVLVPLVFSVCGLRASAIPLTIFISGQIVDSEGRPLSRVEELPGGGTVPIHFDLPAQVRFFASETAVLSISDVATTATVFEGLFEIPVLLVDEVLIMREAWYSLAIDVDEDGIDRDDLFEDRFQLASVPFALSARPVEFFNTLGGNLTTSSGTRGAISRNDNDLVLAPFTTPAGGVRFNRMTVLILSVESGSSFSFGLYDARGRLVVSSGRIAPNFGIEESYLEIETGEITLAPSTVYFTGVTTDPAEFPAGLRLYNSMVPTIPLFGLVPGAASSGEIPNEFDLQDIQASDNAVPINLTLSFAADANGQSRMRWIPRNRP